MSQQGVQSIAVQELNLLRQNRQPVEMIDVQTVEAFTAVHTDFARSIPLVRLDPRSVMASRESADESLYLICSGKIAILVDDAEVARLGKNACLGEMSLVSGLPRSAAAEALEEGRLLRIGSDDFMSLMSTEPEIALALLKTLAQRLRTASAGR